MDLLLDSLTQPQRDAVTHLDGPLLILAGPGSGKTRVVTHRIAHLLEQGVKASEILALTFTNKAAEEMRSRVQQLSPGESVWLSTFHRFGARILRTYAEYIGISPNFTIYDTSDAKQTLRRVIETENYSDDALHAGEDCRGDQLCEEPADHAGRISAVCGSAADADRGGGVSRLSAADDCVVRR